MQYKCRITVFTPTYNRAYILSNLYHSLQRQSFTDFEWLIIDDGSKDNTESLVNSWKLEKNIFQINYLKKENGGKCRAINTALDHAQGELFFTVDSDDYLTDDALYKINAWFRDIDPKGMIQGVSANIGTGVNKTSNSIFNSPFIDASLLQRYPNYNDHLPVMDGERALVFYTEFHKKYRYPSFPNENFMTEAVVWNRMARDGYQIRFFNDVIWIFEYREDGITRAGMTPFIKNPYGYGLMLREKAEFMHYSLLKRFNMIYSFVCDLSEIYQCQTIAECIEAPIHLVKFDLYLHKTIRKVRN